MRSTCGRRVVAAAVGAVCAVASAAWVPRAMACGGTFCDSGAPRSVNQSGENILFVHFEGRLEAHVQIRYQGDPTRFAWLVPLPEEPEVTIGSQPLFDALLESSAPIYGVRTTHVACDGTVTQSEATDGGCGGGITTAPTQTGIAPGQQLQVDSGMMADPIGKTVGSFEVAFLRPSSTLEVATWLADNSFQVPAGTEELLAPYVEAGAVIAAVRLAPDAGVQEIHPIVLRFSATRAAIPIQLTAVASTVDMRVRAFFLGQGRVSPTNYRHLTLNPLRLPWPGFTQAYENAVSRAADETSDGRGFVTEYAGTSAMMAGDRVRDPRWSAEVFESLDALEAIDELKAQGQISCEAGQSICTLPHPLMLPLLQRYLPAPAGTAEGPFYACPECMAEQIDEAAWDAVAFAAAYQERVIDPAEHAVSILEASPYLTRLLTFISPEEMTADPVFHERTDLPDEPNEHWAERSERCGDQTRIRYPDGRDAPDTTGWLGTGPFATMPTAERIEQVGEQGAPLVVLDNTATIDAALERVKADVEAGGGGQAREGPGGSSRGFNCSVAGPAWNQMVLWLLALYAIRRRSRPVR